MDVHRLRILREVADRGTVTEAAHALAMTPSAVSQQLKVLAREAGVPLLEPEGRRLRFTEAGRALVIRADEVLAALARAEDEMAAHRETPRGRVGMALFPSGAALLLPALLRHAAAAGVDLVASDLDMTQVEVESLLADRDVVVFHRDERSAGVAGPRVRTEVLYREPIDVLVPHDHPLAGADRVRVSELAHEDWISVRGGFPVDDVLRSIGQATGVQPRVRHQVNDFLVIEELVLAGHGIALMPRHAATGRLKSLRLSGVRAARLVEVATRPGSRRPAVDAAVRALHDTVAELGSSWGRA